MSRAMTHRVSGWLFVLLHLHVICSFVWSYFHRCPENHRQQRVTSKTPTRWKVFGRYFLQNLHEWTNRLCNVNPVSPCLERFSPPQIRFSRGGGRGPHAQMRPWKELRLWPCEGHFWTRSGSETSHLSSIGFWMKIDRNTRGLGVWKEAMLDEGSSKALLEAAPSLESVSRQLPGAQLSGS